MDGENFSWLSIFVTTTIPGCCTSSHLQASGSLTLWCDRSFFFYLIVRMSTRSQVSATGPLSVHNTIQNFGGKRRGWREDVIFGRFDTGKDYYEILFGFQLFLLKKFIMWRCWNKRIFFLIHLQTWHFNVGGFSWWIVSEI